jgi:hypothetical protein
VNSWTSLKLKNFSSAKGLKEWKYEPQTGKNTSGYIKDLCKNVQSTLKNQ